VLAEVNRCPPDKAPFAVDDQSQPAAFVKECESMVACVAAGAAFAAAGDRARSHQFLQLRDWQTQALGDKPGLYLDTGTG
jgi:hypothetical protein